MVQYSWDGPQPVVCQERKDRPLGAIYQVFRLFLKLRKLAGYGRLSGHVFRYEPRNIFFCPTIHHLCWAIKKISLESTGNLARHYWHIASRLNSQHYNVHPIAELPEEGGENMMQERGLDVIYVLQNFASEFEKYYVTDPAIVARNLHVAVKAACYYWDLKHVNAAVDRNGVNNVTLLVTVVTTVWKKGKRRCLAQRESLE